MGNLGWAEIAVIVVVALVVLGPDKLPQAAQQVGRILRQFRKISTGFRQELQNALDEPIEQAARQRGEQVVAHHQQSTSSQAVNPDTPATSPTQPLEPEPAPSESPLDSS